MIYFKKPIKIPDKVEIKVSKSYILITGPKGELKQKIIPEVAIEISKGKIVVKSDEKKFWGLYRGLIQAMIQGVIEGFEKKLEIVGVGYKAKIENNKLIMGLGFSHSVTMEIPETVDVSVEKNIISVSGISKQQVGQVAANIRSQKKPEPYKGKGIRYFGEEIKLKPGKKATGESDF